MNASTTDWHKKKALFQSALDLPLHERDAFLESADIGESLRADVRHMLQLHQQSGTFLRSPIAGAHEVTDGMMQVTNVTDPTIGQRPGGFLIERLIGCGGMGTVYLARQNHPSRHVAIKILSYHSLRAINRTKRFEHEIAILARLDHPGIAKIYAAGAHDFGRGDQPWFALEFIEGSTLVQFLNGANPSLRDRIKLLIQLCDAVQHAHDRGVIHRDLKPSNIIVSGAASVDVDPGSSNPTASPKIVDFGIGRILDDEGGQAGLTADGEILGTISYMSPEQLTGATTVDNRCDVFALGMIGFEMLTGRLAYDRSSSSLANVISHANSDPPVPLRKLDSKIDRDLEAIFSTALQQDPNMRFRSAAHFAADLNRYLAGERILARPPSWFYLGRKFVARHRALVAGTAATILALTIGLFLYARGERHARMEAARYQYEADKSQAINNFITNDFMMKLIAASASDAPSPKSVSLKDLVSQAASNIETMFADQPAIEAAIRNEVGTIYLNLGSPAEAARQYQIAQQLWQGVFGDDHRDTLKAVSNLGQAYLTAKQLDLAEPLLRQAFEGRQYTLGERDPATLASMNNLAEFYRQTGRVQDAESLFRRVIEIQRSLGLEDDKTTMAAMSNLGSLLIQENRIDEALSLHLKIYDVGCRVYGRDHPLSLNLGMRAAQSLYRAERLSEAEQLLLPIVDRFTSTNGAEHASTISARRLLSRIFKSRNETDRARQQLQIAESALHHGGGDPELLKKIRSELKSL